MIFLRASVADNPSIMASALPACSSGMSLNVPAHCPPANAGNGFHIKQEIIYLYTYRYL